MVTVSSTLIRATALAAALFVGVPAGAAEREVVNTARVQLGRRRPHAHGREQYGATAG